MHIDDSEAGVSDFEVDGDAAALAASMPAESRRNVDRRAHRASHIFDEGLSHEEGRQSRVACMLHHADIPILALRVRLGEVAWNLLDPGPRRIHLRIALEDSPGAPVNDLLQIDAVDVDGGGLHAVAILVVDEELLQVIEGGGQAPVAVNRRDLQ